MKCIFKVNDQLSFEIQSDDEKEVFKELAHIQDIFTHTKDPDGNPAVFSVRVATDAKGKKYDYFEMVSTKNRFVKMAFGTLDDGTARLFPKRFDDDKIKEGNLERIDGSWYWTKFKG